jgi:VWFA-related protein
MNRLAWELRPRVSTIGQVGQIILLACVTACAGASVFASLATSCSARTPAQQNAAPPSATPATPATPPDSSSDDPPPSLVKHAKNPPPQPAAPAQSNPSPSPVPASAPPAAENPAPPATLPPPANVPAAPDAAGAGSSSVPTPATQTTDSPGTPVQSDGSPPSTAGAPGATAPPSPSDSAATVPEMNTRTSQVPLESHVNLVPVRVVVHDSAGLAVENLRKDDFQIKQDGKVQFITHFSVETPASAAKQVERGESIPLPSAAPSPGDANSAPAKPSAGAPGSMALPSRFVALLFDDSHLDVGDLSRARVAALKFIDTSVKPNERIALLTISGRSETDFTDDHTKVRKAILSLMTTPLGAYDPRTDHGCLQITYYQADLIQNKNDTQAISAANADALACANGDTTQVAGIVNSTVAMVLQAGNINTQYAVRRLLEVVRRIAALPGQRSIVLVSPGFLTPTYENDVSEIIDRANQSRVFINTLDARGLYTVDPLGDITQPLAIRANPATSGLSLEYRNDEQRQQSDVLSDLAYSTGGFYFRNNNDLDEGFRETAAEPQVSYVLAFVPENLKNDGKFHTVNVKVLTKEKYVVQARRGFFAAKRGQTPEQLAKQDIEDALFSQEEQQGFPVQLHMQYYKVDQANAKLSVLAHVDLAQVRFDKSGGRNNDDLTVVAGLFDRNGNFVAGKQQVVEMHLKDTTLENLNQTGMTVKTNFDVKPGGYVVRLVVRDSKAAQLSARNGVVEIP